jgi:hypothetical protein
MSLPAHVYQIVQTWHTRYDPELAHEPASRVEWTVENAGKGLTRVRLVHGNLEQSPLTWETSKTAGYGS